MTAFAVPANLAFESYQDLIAGINDWLDRSDLTGSAPMMIALCEARLRRELQGLAMENTASVSVVSGSANLPTDYDMMRVVTYNGQPLDNVSAEIGRQFAAGTVPVAYSLEAGALRVWPAWSGTLDLVYQAKLTPLSDENSANPVLLEHPDAYFFGSLMFAEGYLANDQRAVFFKALWDEAVASVKAFYVRQRRDRPRLRNPVVVV
jgi:hypothetical protein